MPSSPISTLDSSPTEREEPSSSTAAPSYGTFRPKKMSIEKTDPLPGYDSDGKGTGSPVGKDVDEEMLAGIRDSEGTTLFEKKCMVVNAEFDRQGMGRYQWCIFGLCGFGYLLDLMWAQCFGLILSPLEQEFGFPGN